MRAFSSRYTGGPEKHRKQGLRAEIGIDGVSSNMDLSQRSTSKTTLYSHVHR